MKEIGKHKTGEIIEYECICGETFWKHSKLVKEIVCPKCRKNKDGIFSCIGCRYFNGHQIDEEFTENTFCTHKENRNDCEGNASEDDCPIVKEQY